MSAALSGSERRTVRLALMHCLLKLRPYLGTPCPYCGVRMTAPGPRGSARADSEVSRDHFIPRSRGGADAADNLLAVCVACNDLKGDLLPTEWLELLRADEDPRAARLAVILDHLPQLLRRCEAVAAREREEARACR